jgi:hypothetical protein
MELLIKKVETHKLTSNHVLTLASGVISWQSKHST